MKITATCARKKHTSSLDPTKFDDVYFEAARRAITKWNKKRPFKVSPVITCSDGIAYRIYNTYYVLIGVGLLSYAEKLRTEFKKRYDCDLKSENIKDEPRT